MLKSKLTAQELGELSLQLKAVLAERKNDLKVAVQAATNDSSDDFEHDYRVISDVLKSSGSTDFNKVYESRKPKGKVLIMLSYNEPLIMCIDPILNALIAGNEVYVRPSSASSEVFQQIWDPVFSTIPWLPQRLSVIDINHQSAIDLIPSVQAVYFFGSRHVAEKIGVECSKHLVEFWPETEGSDFAIYSDTAPIAVDEFADYIYSEAFSHSGQICQRIQGVYVHQSHYDSLKNALLSVVGNATPADFNDPTAQQIKMRGHYDSLVASLPSAKYHAGASANMPSIVTDIPAESPVCQDAFFLPTLWLIPYVSNDPLIGNIAKRPIQFGANIWTSDQSLVDSIAQRSRLTRITVNTNHIEIRHHEGWGGSQPTSFGGNIQWSEKFSNQFSIIDK